MLDEAMEQQELSLVGENAVVCSLWKKVQQFLKKLNIILPYDPTTVMLGIYQNEFKTYVLTKTCT